MFLRRCHHCWRSLGLSLCAWRAPRGCRPSRERRDGRRWVVMGEERRGGRVSWGRGGRDGAAAEAATRCGRADELPGAASPRVDASSKESDDAGTLQRAEETMPKELSGGTATGGFVARMQRGEWRCWLFSVRMKRCSGGCIRSSRFGKRSDGWGAKISLRGLVAFCARCSELARRS